jgi:hypothetical protein
MKKKAFEHAVRAAGAILGVNELLVIGSQAIHAAIDYELPEAERSIDVSIAGLQDKDGSKADLIDGSIGELSMFQETFGYYAQGVTPQTAILPGGWRKRLIAYESPATNGVTAMCLEPHDLWVSKAIAGRPKDREFCEALIARKLVEVKTLHTRLGKVRSLDPRVRNHVLSLISDASN